MQADNYAGYNGLFDAARFEGAITHAACWAQGMSPATVLECAPSFVPAVVEPIPARIATPVEKRQRRSRAGAIELEIDGVAVKIASGADKRTITAVIEALKATR